MAIILAIYSAILALAVWQENQNGQDQQVRPDKMGACPGE